MEFLHDFGLPELLIILVIIVILFGPGRIGNIAGELGKGIRAFKNGVSGKDEDEKPAEEGKPESPTDEK
jgi:sec-independent protein translocase protein TatA